MVPLVGTGAGPVLPGWVSPSPELPGTPAPLLGTTHADPLDLGYSGAGCELLDCIRAWRGLPLESSVLGKIRASRRPRVASVEPGVGRSYSLLSAASLYSMSAL